MIKTVIVIIITIVNIIAVLITMIFNEIYFFTDVRSVDN